MAEALKDLDSTVTEYVNDLRAAKRAPGTIRNDETDLAMWAAWVRSQPDAPAKLADVRKPHVAHYLAERIEIEAVGTVHSRPARLRAFFKWCEREEIVTRSPMHNIPEPRLDDEPPVVLTLPQL